MDFTLDLLIRAFFGRGDLEVCHSELCLLVVGSYSKTQVSSPVITPCRKLGSLVTRSKISQETNTRLPFCSSDKFFGTSFALIFLMCRSSVMIWSTSVFGSPTSSAINCTCKRRSLSRTTFTRATLFSVLAVEGRPARCSSSTLSLPSLNTLYCTTWRLGPKTKQHPHKLSSTTATFWNQTFRVSHRTWSRNAAPDSSAFSPVTRHKNYYSLC